MGEPAEVVISVWSGTDWTETDRSPHPDPVPDLTTVHITSADVGLSIGDRCRIEYVDTEGATLRRFEFDVAPHGLVLRPE